jgi:hypothetical protein
VFVGSASETRGIVDALESELRDMAIIDRWDVDVFRPGHFTLEELTREVEQVDFAIFVLGREDATESRGGKTPSPRDNVIFEAGLFTAILGRERTFYVVDKEGTKIPSDWAGLGYKVFDNTEERPRDKVYEAVKMISQQIATWQPLKSLGSLAAIVGHWWQFVVNFEVGAIMSLMEITATEERTPMLRGSSWSADGAPVARYRSQAASYEETNRTLYYSWEGEHPREQAIPRYFGVGEITFHPATGEPASRGEGWFSTSRSDVREVLTKSTVCVRASSDEVAVLQGADRDKRASLVQAKLEERNQIDS